MTHYSLGRIIRQANDKHRAAVYGTTFIIASSSIAGANPLNVSDSEYVQQCLTGNVQFFERTCVRPTDAEMAIVSDDDFFSEARNGKIPDKTLERLGRWYAIAKTSASYCKAGPGRMTVVDIGPHTEHRLERLRKRSKRFARDYRLGEKTARLMIDAAKVSAQTELDKPKYPMQTWYCSTNSMYLPLIDTSAPANDEQAAVVAGFVEDWNRDNSPIIASVAAFNRIKKEAPPLRFATFMGAYRVIWINFPKCVGNDVWQALEDHAKVMRGEERTSPSSEANQYRRKGRDWADAEIFSLEQSTLAAENIPPMTAKEKAFIEREYEITNETNAGDWKEILNEVRSNAHEERFAGVRCAMMRQEFSDVLAYGAEPAKAIQPQVNSAVQLDDGFTRKATSEIYKALELPLGMFGANDSIVAIVRVKVDSEGRIVSRPDVSMSTPDNQRGQAFANALLAALLKTRGIAVGGLLAPPADAREVEFRLSYFDYILGYY